MNKLFTIRIEENNLCGYTKFGRSKRMTRVEERFFELLRVALGTQKELTSPIPVEEWNEIPEIAVKQCVMGLLLSAIEQLPRGQRPPNNILLAVHDRVQEIEEQNRYINKLTYATSKRFEVDGFPNCILKGQGIATLYPNPLRRESGDIDVWLQGDRDKIIEYVRNVGEAQEPSPLHIGFDLKDGTPVEAHFTPSYFSNPFTDRKFNKWAKAQQAEQTKHYVPFDNGTKLPIPTNEFNIIFILSHAYQHFIGTGVGLRQLIDYFYVLKHAHEEVSPSSLHALRSTLQEFSLDKFCAAVCWLLHTQLGLPSDYLIVEPNAKEGEFLLKEVLLTGNFGHSDERTKNGHRLSGKRYRLGHLFLAYPSEVFWYTLQGIKRLITREEPID